jgi:hypothetical protein
VAGGVVTVWWLSLWAPCFGWRTCGWRCGDRLVAFPLGPLLWLVDVWLEISFQVQLKVSGNVSW